VLGRIEHVLIAGALAARIRHRRKLARGSDDPDRRCDEHRTQLDERRCVRVPDIMVSAELAMLW
jgi:hypothetical protein